MYGFAINRASAYVVRVLVLVLVRAIGFNRSPLTRPSCRAYELNEPLLLSASHCTGPLCERCSGRICIYFGVNDGNAIYSLSIFLYFTTERQRTNWTNVLNAPIHREDEEEVKETVVLFAMRSLPLRAPSPLLLWSPRTTSIIQFRTYCDAF